MSDGKWFSATSTTEIKDKISRFAFDVHGSELTSLILDLELAIEEGLGLKEVYIFGSDDFVAVRSVLSFVKSYLELFFHLRNHFVELRKFCRIDTFYCGTLIGFILRVRGARVFMIWRTLKASSSFPSYTKHKDKDTNLFTISNAGFIGRELIFIHQAVAEFFKHSKWHKKYNLLEELRSHLN